MKVEQLKVGPMENFVYLVMDGETKEALVVDSGWETSPIVRAADALRARVKYVVATHGHFDHVSTIDELAGRTGAVAVAHKDSPIRSDMKVEGGTRLRLGSNEVTVLHTPGHTPDSICLFDGQSVFTGDTLFVGTIGRFEPGDQDKIHGSIRTVILSLPPETRMYPGHDYGVVPYRTLGEEKAENPFLRP